jgi:drug/metabolite transporter (DMT)-like permease
MQNTNTKNLAAIGLVVIGMSSHVMNSALLRRLSELHSGFAVLWLSSLLLLLMVAPWALCERGRHIRSARPLLHVWRALLSALSALCVLYALPHLSLGEVTLYQLTTPIWLIPFALLLLGESVQPYRWMGMLIGFAGVAIVTGPVDLQGFKLAVIAALASALSDAMLGVLLKKASRDESPRALLWWTYVGKTIIFALLAGFEVPAMQWKELGWLILIAVTAVVTMTCFILAYRMADATVAETGTFSAVVAGPLLGWLMFDETTGPRFWLGAAVLTFGLLLTMFERPLRTFRIGRNTTSVRCES